jgi:phage shock protein C
MTSPYPPQTPPRRLERSRSNRVLGGVCAGVASYLNMDVTLVRILTVVLALFTGVPVVAYIVALFLMPEEPVAAAGSPTGYAPTAPTGASDPVWGPGGAPWDRTAGSTPPPPAPPAAAASPAPSPEPGPAPQDAEPATAAPEGPSVPDPEPVAETASEPAPGQESSWESAPAEPQDSPADAAGDTPPSTSTQDREGDKPAGA